MTNLTILDLDALNISSGYYLSWILDVEIDLDAVGLENTNQVWQQHIYSRICQSNSLSSSSSSPSVSRDIISFSNVSFRTTCMIDTIT